MQQYPNQPYGQPPPKSDFKRGVGGGIGVVAGVLIGCGVVLLVCFLFASVLFAGCAKVFTDTYEQQKQHQSSGTTR